MCWVLMVITNSSFMTNPVTDPKTDPMTDLVTDTMTITINGPMTDQNCDIRAVWLVHIYFWSKSSPYLKFHFNNLVHVHIALHCCILQLHSVCELAGCPFVYTHASQRPFVIEAANMLYCIHSHYPHYHHN